MKYSINDFVVLQYDNIVEYILKLNIMLNVKSIKIIVVKI